MNRIWSAIAAAALSCSMQVLSAEAEPIIRGKAESAWIAQLDDMDPYEKLYAANALGLCGPQCSDALDALRARYREPSLPIIASTAMAESILRISPAPETEVIAFLTDMLSAEMRKPYANLPPVEAIRALGTAGPRARGAVPLLRAIFQLGGSFQLEAGNALEKIGSPYFN